MKVSRTSACNRSPPTSSCRRSLLTPPPLQLLLLLVLAHGLAGDGLLGSSALAGTAGSANLASFSSGSGSGDGGQSRSGSSASGGDDASSRSGGGDDGVSGGIFGAAIGARAVLAVPKDGVGGDLSGSSSATIGSAGGGAGGVSSSRGKRRGAQGQHQDEDEEKAQARGVWSWRWEFTVWVLSGGASGALVAISVHKYATLSHLEADYLNPHEAAATCTQLQRRERTAYAALLLLLLLARAWGLLGVAIAAILLMHAPSRLLAGRGTLHATTQAYEAADMYARLRTHKRTALVGLAVHAIVFATVAAQWVRAAVHLLSFHARPF